jgi:hypothetical protein
MQAGLRDCELAASPSTASAFKFDESQNWLVLRARATFSDGAFKIEGLQTPWFLTLRATFSQGPLKIEAVVKNILN